jgi:DNA-binding transcriptional ArsR family regulator
MQGNEKADLIIHPIRLRIMQLLGQKSMTTAELDHLMPDVPTSSLYRHIRKLLNGGLIEVEETHAVKGTPERTYRLVQNPNITPEDARLMSKEDHLRYFSTYVAGLVQDFKSYLNAGEEVDMVADRAGYSELLFYADTEELDEFFVELQKNLARFRNQTSKQGRRLRKIVFINHPIKEEK